MVEESDEVWSLGDEGSSVTTRAVRYVVASIR